LDGSCIFSDESCNSLGILGSRWNGEGPAGVEILLDVYEKEGGHGVLFPWFVCRLVWLGNRRIDCCDLAVMFGLYLPISRCCGVL